MPSATIEAKYINPPQSGKKMGSIKAADGTYYGVSPELLGQLKKDGVYEVFFEDREWQGKTYHTIKTVKAHKSQTAPAAAKVLDQAERARTNTADAERMWVCALLGHAIGNGAINPLALTEVVEAGRIFLEAHTLIWSTAKIPQTNSKSAEPGMDDEIPF